MSATTNASESDSFRTRKPTSRRSLLGTAAAMAGALSGCKTSQPSADELPSRLGPPAGPYGERSGFEKSVRLSRAAKNPQAGSSTTPLQDTYGVITPSALHFERPHAGIPN